MDTTAVISEDDRTFWHDLADQAAKAACARLGHVWVEVADLDWDERSGSDLFRCKRCRIDMCAVFGHSWIGAYIPKLTKAYCFVCGSSGRAASELTLSSWLPVAFLPVGTP